jgi:Uma2 family endonuclease
MATIVAPKLTYQDLREMLNDSRRYELIDGEVYMAPSPNRKHQRTVFRIAIKIHALVESRDLGEVYIAPFDVVFDQSNVTQPDVLFVQKERLSIITAANVSGAPDLAVEVISPGTARFDRETKLQVYARARIPELWYVDPEGETLDILNLGAGGHYALTQRATGDGQLVSAVLPGLRLTPREIFA